MKNGGANRWSMVLLLGVSGEWVWKLLGFWVLAWQEQFAPSIEQIVLLTAPSQLRYRGCGPGTLMPRYYLESFQCLDWGSGSPTEKTGWLDERQRSEPCHHWPEMGRGLWSGCRFGMHRIFWYARSVLPTEWPNQFYLCLQRFFTENIFLTLRRVISPNLIYIAIH